MNNTGLATTVITSIVIQEVTSEAIRDHQHGEDPGLNLEANGSKKYQPVSYSSN